MKKYLFSALVLVSSVASAGVIRVGVPGLPVIPSVDSIRDVRQAGAVQIMSVQTQAVGEQGFPSTQVKAIAQFGNKCEVPTGDELVTVVTYSKNYDSLYIALGNTSERICPQVFAPVTMTIELGQFTRPNDGNFKSIAVNQVAATRK